LADRWAQQHDRSYSAFPKIGFIMHTSAETLRWNAGAILAGDVGQQRLSTESPLNAPTESIMSEGALDYPSS